ncbi:hypothetical protein [Telmatospirillum siberiense]|uniref:hypothetical protein n=1 Tax=Telmatospirillum siberiense TaxID=382514 RepID=UPI001304392B|nr:hypothetical protein [Telmatospirillum siberiense]
MSDAASSVPTTGAFLNSLGSSILSGGAASKRKTTVSDVADLGNAIGSQLLGVSGQSATSSDRLSPFLSDATTTPSLRNAVTNALLGGSDSGQTAQNLAALGSTLNAMAKTAQSALTTTSTTARAQALESYQTLYDSLDQSSSTINGAAGNAASLGLSTPGDWSNSDTTAGTASITGDMTSVVKAHTVVQEMIQSASATLIKSYLLG